MQHDTLDFIIQATNNITVLWEKRVGSTAPQSVVNKIDSAMLNWMRDLTNTLRLWSDKGSFMTDGELILARANLGAVVESWLKFFYCVYNEDYQKSPILNKEMDVIEPENLSFERLKQYSKDILYNKNDSIEIWLDSVQKKRNAIHSFNNRNIGTANDFYDDLETLYDFINQIEIRLPALEGYNDDASFTIGYQVPYLPFDRKAIIRV